MFLSDTECLLVKKVAYRYYIISELVTQPEKLKMLYIARLGKWRQILNEKDMIKSVLSKTSKNVNFEKTSFDRQSFRDQILSMRNTDILFGYHGAAFVNIMFMMPYSGFIELFSPLAILPYYTNMANRAKLIYRCIMNSTFDTSQELPDNKRNMNIYVDIDEVVEYINDLTVLVRKEKYRIVSVY